MYHMVSEPLSDQERPYACPPRRFASHMSALVARGYSPVSLGQVQEHLAGATAMIDVEVRALQADGSFAEVWRLSQDVERQSAENAQLKERNQALEGEVLDLKQGLEAVEERAREELGMLKEGETFYQIVDEPGPAEER